MNDSTALALFAAANDQGTQDARVMYDAIVRGLARGPVGIMDELADEGITTERVDRVLELEDELAATQNERDEAQERVDELEREVEEADATIEDLREQLEDLRRQPTDRGAEPWKVGNDGTSSRRWFVCRHTSPGSLSLEYHDGPNGRLARFASAESAQRRADALNATAARTA